MSVVEAYFGGKKMVPIDNTEMLSATVSTMVIEGIAQNTSGSIFEPEVSLYLYFFPFDVQLIVPAWHLRNLHLFLPWNQNQCCFSFSCYGSAWWLLTFCSMSQGGQATEVTGSPTEKAILSWGLQV